MLKWLLLKLCFLLLIDYLYMKDIYIQQKATHADMLSCQVFTFSFSAPVLIVRGPQEALKKLILMEDQEF